LCQSCANRIGFWLLDWRLTRAVKAAHRQAKGESS
jgi:hypothetical protein